MLASRMPASEASTDPRIQLYRAIEIGGAPFNAARVGLSTTARMATPVRLTNRRLRSTSATTTASTIAATLSRVRRASQMLMVCDPTRLSSRAPVSGGQNFCARPMHITNKAMVTTTLVCTLASRNDRITRSVAIPTSGANTASTITTPNIVGTPCCTVSA